jgi:acetyltransferase-like isoleucine patch superfamily enzyme
MKGWRRRLRLVTLAAAAFLPGPAKRLAYRRLFGYEVGPNVRIGLSLIDAGKVVLGEHTHIGHFNVITRLGEFRTGPHTNIGFLNLIRGGEAVILGAYSTIMRLNVLNAIPDHDCVTTPTSALELGDGAIIVSEHRVDFTDRVQIGRNVIVGGRASSLWTHNRQDTAPIVIGDFCYLGSEVRLAPGSGLADESILALGSVLADPISEPRSLVAGVPARVVRRLNDHDLTRLRRKTRNDIPDSWYDRGPAHS